MRRSPCAGLLPVITRGTAQDATGIGRVQDEVYKSLGLASGKNQAGATFYGSLSGNFGAVEDEVSHRAALKVCGALDE
jgi:hypothetical protein